jgi:hypothetical protein
MGQHVRGKLGPAGRVQLVGLTIEEGCSERVAAAALSVAPATAHHWKHRFLVASGREIEAGSWALDRSSRPHRSPNRTPVEVERRVCDERRRSLSQTSPRALPHLDEVVEGWGRVSGTRPHPVLLRRASFALMPQRVLVSIRVRRTARVCR